MEFDDRKQRLLGLYDGEVVDNADPTRCGRVRVRIPGLIEPKSAWAEPVGKPGGSAARGELAVPEIGATVVVQFLMGEPDRPKYQGGHWGKGEQLTYIKDVAPADAHLVYIIETDAFDIVVDSRPGHQRLILREKANGTLISLKDGLIQLGDGAQEKIVLGTSWWAAESAKLDALKAAFQAQLTASQGPFTALVPGWMALIAALDAFKLTAAATNSFLSDLSRTMQKWPP